MSENEIKNRDEEEYLIKLENAEYILKLLPDVFVSSGDVQKFDPSRILNSMIKETSISKKEAKRVTELVVKRIIASGIKFLSGPHIRELVCSALSELHLEEERKNFTRIGLPIYEYEKLIESNYNKRESEYTTPENIQRWSAGQIASEYSLLKLLNEKQNRAHLSGDIHIHSLRYFDVRPYAQIWDIRMILKNGIPLGKFIHLPTIPPPEDAISAIYQASKWLSIAFSEYVGEQSYIYFNTFISPYLKDLDYKEILKLAKLFIFEINQQCLIKGVHNLNSSIILYDSIPKILMDIDAIGPNGKIIGKYKDFEEENFLFFKALSEAYIQGDKNKKLFFMPKHKVLLDKNSVYNNLNSKMINILNETKSMGTTIFINNSVPWISELGYLGPFFTHPLLKYYIEQNKNLNLNWNSTYFNIGSLQTISLNLPRISYQASKNDDKLFEILEERLNIIKDIFSTKLNLYRKRLNNKNLFLSQNVIDDQPIFDLNKQSCGIGLIGLNEMVKYHIETDLNNFSSINFIEKLLKFIVEKCKEYTKDLNILVTLWDQPGEYVSYRFAKLDLSHFSTDAKKVINGDINKDAIYYTSSGHLPSNSPLDIDEKLKIMEKIAPYIANNYNLQIWLSKNSDDLNLNYFNSIIEKCIEKKIPEFSFGYNFSLCIKCNYFNKGIYSICPNCNEKNSIKTIAKITDYYGLVELLNDGKKQEINERVFAI